MLVSCNTGNVPIIGLESCTDVHFLSSPSKDSTGHHLSCICSWDVIIRVPGFHHMATLCPELVSSSCELVMTKINSQLTYITNTLHSRQNLLLRKYWTCRYCLVSFNIGTCPENWSRISDLHFLSSPSQDSPGHHPSSISCSWDVIIRVPGFHHMATLCPERFPHHVSLLWLTV